jgi:hypothetical protein
MVLAVKTTAKKGQIEGVEFALRGILTFWARSQSSLKVRAMVFALHGAGLAVDVGYSVNMEGTVR